MVESDRISITIDGRRRKAQRGQSILEVANEAGIKIPTLCYHESLSPWGSCRLCVVEATLGGRTRVVASCVTPAEDGMVVKTNTQRIKEIRRMIIALLLARCPGLDVLKEYARELGVGRIPFEKGDDDCFLCGMCVRACAEIVGIGAIGFAHRGAKTEVEPPFGLASSACIGCGTCTTICPARTLTLDKVFARQTMHRSKDQIVGRCIICETYYSGA
ncbi:MAG TPA: 2Fe-2S iron-sulfur cluster binding domain-containing protein [Firmicutes bacterium]|nr:2Fe-2S iron-sulfur cluster binding domain-containing protein [Bacillota bacterium]